MCDRLLLQMDAQKRVNNIIKNTYPLEILTCHTNSANKTGFQLQMSWDARVLIAELKEKTYVRVNNFISVDFRTQVFIWFLISMSAEIYWSYLATVGS